jgi:hypothetical protein
MYRERIATVQDNYRFLGPILAAAPDLIRERNALWDALSEILEEPDCEIPEELRAPALAAIEAAQNADAARGWEKDNEPLALKGA